MGKRLTVRRMLKNRLSESVSILNSSVVHKDMYEIYGHQFEAEKVKQIQENMKYDIKQLNYLLECLDVFDVTK